MPYTTRNLLTETYQDLTILSPLMPLSATDAAFGLLKLVRLFDNWNAERAGVYANRMASYTLTPALNPHTIGPDTATFTVTQRPVSIDSANLLITQGSETINYPLNIRNAQWEMGLSIPGLSTDIPSDLYYNPTWPNGEIYLYPVPATAYGLKLLTRIVLTDLALDDTVSLPPGYRDAIILTLGEMIAPSYPPAEANPDAAAKARARIFANNDVIPNLVTADAGLTGNGRGRWFDYRSGVMRP